MTKGKSFNPSKLCLPIRKMGTRVLTCVQMGEASVRRSGSAPSCLQSTSLFAEHFAEVILGEP